MSEAIKKLAKEAQMLIDAGSSGKGAADGGFPPDSPFSLELASYPDIVIRKEGKRNIKSLVIMPSVGAVFIKTQALSKGIPTGEAESSVPDENEYRNFVSGMPDIRLPDGFWTKKVSGGISFFREVLELFEDPMVMEMIRKRMFPEDVDVLEDRRSFTSRYNLLAAAYSEYPGLYSELKDTEKSFSLLVQEIPFCNEIRDAFGIDGLRAFLREYEKTPLWLIPPETDYSETGGIHRKWRYRPVLPQFPMKAKSFTNYVLYESFRMGYAKDINSFFEEWNDTLQMEMTLYGKIRDKYPGSLPTVHRQLAYKTSMMNQEIDEKRLEERLKEVSVYEGKYRGLVFKAPECRQDFYDEAVAQANCLASYVSRVIDGDCQIMFVRKEESPESSYITLSVKNGRPQEAKYADNADIKAHDRFIIEKWFEKCSCEGRKK